MNRTATTAVIAVGQLALVGLAVAPQLSARTMGDTYLMEVAPLDPIDPFRGAYVALDYPGLRTDGSSSQEGGLGALEDGESGDVYVLLAERDGVWVAEDWVRERPEDVPLLAQHFLNHFAQELGRRPKRLEPDALAMLQGYAWPGNVRELENRMKRAVIMCDGRQVTAADLDLAEAQPREEEAIPINLRAAREIADRRAIRQALARTENNISGAAKLLGVSRPTLYDLLKQYHLQA